MEREKSATWMQHRKSATWKKCNMEKVQHEKSATLKKCNIKKVKHGKNATWRKCDMEKVQNGKSTIGKSATWKKCNMEKVQHENCRGLARTPRISKMENFSTMFNGFGNYCCKPLHLRCLWGFLQHFWKYCKMNKVQLEKSATCEECNRRRMQNENIVTCKSAILNRAILKKSATRKKVQHENITTQKSAAWKWCSMKKG